MNTSEINKKAIDSIHNAVQSAYEQGYSDASKEVLAEAINALTLRLESTAYTEGIEQAVAVLRSLISGGRVLRKDSNGEFFLGD